MCSSWWSSIYIESIPETWFTYLSLSPVFFISLLLETSNATSRNGEFLGSLWRVIGRQISAFSGSSNNFHQCSGQDLERWARWSAFYCWTELLLFYCTFNWIYIVGMDTDRSMDGGMDGLNRMTITNHHHHHQRRMLDAHSGGTKEWRNCNPRTTIGDIHEEEDEKRRHRKNVENVLEFLFLDGMDMDMDSDNWITTELSTFSRHSTTTRRWRLATFN